MSKKKNMYNEFCKKSTLIVNNIHSKNIKNIINVLNDEDISEKLKLLKFSAKNVQEKKKIKKIISNLNIDEYPINVWGSFKFYFQLKDSLKREYFCTLNHILKFDPLLTFLELNKKLIEHKEDPQNVIDFINTVFNYNRVKISRIKQYIHKIKSMKSNAQEQIKECFRCFNNYKTIRDLISLFEYDFIDFEYKDNRNIYVINNPKYDLKAMAVADLDNKVVLQWQEIILRLSYMKNILDLNPKEYLGLIEHELLSAFPINKFLFNDEQIKGVPIKFWLKVFLLIFMENWKFLQEKSILCKKSKKEWLEILVAGGIEDKYHCDIIKTLSFFEYSCGKRDIQNYPFIIENDIIYTIPGIICSSDVVRVLISFFENSEENIQFKGEYYENSIRDKWARNGIKNVKKKEKILGKDFDCDMAFLFNNDLFICEIKNLSQPNSLHKWHKFYIKTQENIIQLERTVNHYSQKFFLEDIVKMLSVNPNWLPEKIHSMLIYSCYIGTTMRVKESWVASEIDIYNFFSKTPISHLKISENKKEAIYFFEYLKGYEYLEDNKHSLTIDDFEKYMQCPMALKFQQNKIKVRKEKIFINGVNLFVDCIDISN